MLNTLISYRHFHLPAALLFGGLLILIQYTADAVRFIRNYLQITLAKKQRAPNNEKERRFQWNNPDYSNWPRTKRLL